MSNLPQAPGDAFADPSDQQDSGDMYFGDGTGVAPPQAVDGAAPEDIFYTDLDSPVVRLRGLPFYVTEEEVRSFVFGYPIDDPDGVIIIPFGPGRGDGYIRFVSPEVAAAACNQLQRKTLGSRYIELQPSTDSMMATIRAQVAQRNAMLSNNRVLRLRGLPFRAGAEDVLAFFEDAASEIVDVAFVETSDGRQTGDAYVELASDAAADKCMLRNRQLMGTRYIEVIDSTAVEREVALTTHKHRNGNTSRSVGGGRDSTSMFRQPAMLPTVSVGTTAPQFSPFDMFPNPAAMGWGGMGMMNPFAAMAFQTMLLQQQQQLLLIQQQQAQQIQQQQQKAASQAQRRGARQQQSNQPQRYVVRIRGLPFSSNEAMIAEFFDDVRIPRQGVHMVLNLQDKPTGEAFVEVVSEEDVQLALGHNGGALGNRYIEVFRSSIADMNRLGGEPVQPSLGGSNGTSPPVTDFPPPLLGMLPTASPYFPMLPMMPPPLMPTAAVGHPAPLLPPNVKVEVKPNEEYLRKYQEEQRLKQQQQDAGAASPSSSSNPEVGGDKKPSEGGNNAAAATTATAAAAASSQEGEGATNGAVAMQPEQSP